MFRVEETPRQAGEKASLQAFLHNQRALMVWKLADLDFESATQPMVPSGTSLLGMVNHLAAVELWWFGDVIAGGDYEVEGDLAVWLETIKAAWEAGDDDADFRVEPPDTIDTVVERYTAAVKLADGLIDRYPLDHISPNKREVSLRWALLHMIEETARHAGHADIIRELIDGSTGYLPG